MDRRPLRVLLTTASLAALAGGGAAASPASAMTWRASLAGSTLTLPESGGGVFVDDARVWWLTRRDTTAPSGLITGASYELRSRSLSGGATRRIALDLGAQNSPDPTYPRFDALQFRVSRGAAIVTGQWTKPLDPASGAAADRLDPPIFSRFDTKTGARLPDAAFPSATQNLVNGPAPVLADSARPALSSALTGRTFSATTPGASMFAAGRSILGYTAGTYPEQQWAKGKGTLTVKDLESGRTRYRKTARQATGKAPSSGEVAPRLQANGTLALTVFPDNRRARPVWVDSAGRTRLSGPTLTGVSSLTTTALSSSRVLVDVTRKVSGRSGQCRTLWLADTKGRRWRKLAAKASPSATASEVADSSSRAVVIRIPPTRTDRDPDSIFVLTNPSKIALTAKAPSGC